MEAIKVSVVQTTFEKVIAAINEYGSTALLYGGGGYLTYNVAVGAFGWGSSSSGSSNIGEGTWKGSSYGTIKAAPGFPHNVINYLYTDLYSFMHDEGPSSRLDVFMKYKSLAVSLVAVAGGLETAGVRAFAYGGKEWHVGLELVGKRNLIHLGNWLGSSVQEGGVHLSVGYVRPMVSWFQERKIEPSHFPPSIFHHL